MHKKLYNETFSYKGESKLLTISYSDKPANVFVAKDKLPYMAKDKLPYMAKLAVGVQNFHSWENVCGSMLVDLHCQSTRL